MKKALKRLDGVQDVKVSLEAQNARLVLEPGQPLQPKQIQEAVRKADFSAGEIRVTAAGEISANSDSGGADLTLRLPDSGQVFLLLSGVRGNHPTHQKALSELLATVQTGLAAGQKQWLIHGQVGELKDQVIALTARTAEPLTKEP